MDILCATRFEVLLNNVYFISDLSGVVGKIDVLTGEIELLETPTDMAGKISYYIVFTSIRDSLYFFTYNKNKLYEYNVIKKKWSEYILPQYDFYDTSCAGVVNIDDDIYVVYRDNAIIAKFDVVSNKCSYLKIGIEEKVMWAVADAENIYILSWNARYIYQYNVLTKILSKVKVNIGDKYSIRSLSPIPLHSMKYYDNKLLFSDSNKVFCYNLLSEAISILVEIPNDIGSRLIVIGDYIIIPPYNGNNFYLFNLKTNELKCVDTIPKDIVFYKDKKGSITGTPCEDIDNVYIPVLFSDTMLIINKKNLRFNWKKLRFNEENLSNIWKMFNKMGVVLQENVSVLGTLRNYLKGLET